MARREAVSDYIGAEGDIAIFRDGSAVVLGRRKSEALGPPPGWWLRGGGGLTDTALAGPDWTLLTEADRKLIALQRSATTTVDVVTLAQDVQNRVEDFTNELRALGIHVGVNGRCATCTVEWPCPPSGRRRVLDPHR